MKTVCVVLAINSKMVGSYGTYAVFQPLKRESTFWRQMQVCAPRGRTQAFCRKLLRRSLPYPPRSWCTCSSQSDRCHSPWCPHMGPCMDCWPWNQSQAPIGCLTDTSYGSPGSRLIFQPSSAALGTSLALLSLPTAGQSYLKDFWVWQPCLVGSQPWIHSRRVV